MSTTLLVGSATATVIDAVTTVTQTVETTIIQAPTPVFINDCFGALCLMNVGIFMASLLVCAILGFSRLLAIPLFASFFGCIDNGLEWYAYGSGELYPLKNRSVALVFADLSWGAQDACLTLYSFVLLEKILRGKQRRFFMMMFSFLFLCVIGERLGITILHNQALTKESLYPIISEVNRAYFLTLATLEIVSACFLLRVFYKAHHRSNSMVADKTSGTNSGLFAQLAHSSEVRVATLAGIGITRAICFPFDNPVAGGFDRMAYVMENAFPIFLLIDLLTTRVVKLQATVDSHSGGSYTGASMEKSVASRRSERINSAALGSSSGKGAVESISRDFPAYIGKGSWAVSTSQPAAVSEVPEEEISKADKQSV